jgi:hypothetical protein
MGRARRSRWPPRPPPCGFCFPVLRSETAEGGLLSQFQLFSTPARARAAETLKLGPRAQRPRQPGLWPGPGGDHSHVADRPAPHADFPAPELSLGQMRGKR